MMEVMGSGCLGDKYMEGNQTNVWKYSALDGEKSDTFNLEQGIA